MVNGGIAVLTAVQVRDLVYEELLVARLNPEDQEKYDEVKAGKGTFSDYVRANIIDGIEQQLCIMPGALETKNYKFIAEASGLLRASKQINDEASRVLLGKNTFVILPEWERVHPFWRCESPGCYPPQSPCYVFFHNFQKIKHIYVIVQHKRALDDPKRALESANLEKNIKNMVRCILESGIKLHTLKVRYTSLFDGQIDAVRHNIEDKPAPGTTDNPTMLKDCHGRYHYVKRAEVYQKIFCHGNILESLRCLKGIADNVQIRGDLPQAYMDKLTALLTAPARAPAMQQKQKSEEAARKSRHEADKGLVVVNTSCSNHVRR